MQQNLSGQDSIRVTRLYENDTRVTKSDSVFYQLPNTIFISLDEGFNDSLHISIHDTILCKVHLALSRNASRKENDISYFDLYSPIRQRQTTLTTADTIYNNSAIYFDYNLPVITNTVDTRFRSNIITSVPTINRNAYLVSVNPNPAMSDIYYSACCFTAGETIELSVYDMQGKKLMTRSARPILQKINGSIPVQQLASGIYLLRIMGKRGSSTIKFIKQY